MGAKLTDESQLTRQPEHLISPRGRQSGEEGESISDVLHACQVPGGIQARNYEGHHTGSTRISLRSRS